MSEIKVVDHNEIYTACYI